MDDSPLNESDLAQFTGSESVYRHSLVRNIVYTEGAQYVAEKGGAYWLLDKIATLNAPYGDKRVRAEEFQVWKLTVHAEESNSPVMVGALLTSRNGKRGPNAVLSCSDGGKNGHKSKVVYIENIEYTDFPLPEITLWFTNNTIFLPSEY